MNPEDKERIQDGVKKIKRDQMMGAETEYLVPEKRLARLTDMELLGHLSWVRKQIETLVGQETDPIKIYRTELFTQIEKIASELKRRRREMPHEN